MGIISDEADEVKDLFARSRAAQRSSMVPAIMGTTKIDRHAKTWLLP